MDVWPSAQDAPKAPSLWSQRGATRGTFDMTHNFFLSEMVCCRAWPLAGACGPFGLYFMAVQLARGCEGMRRRMLGCACKISWHIPPHKAYTNFRKGLCIRMHVQANLFERKLLCTCMFSSKRCSKRNASMDLRDRTMCPCWINAL